MNSSRSRFDPNRILDLVVLGAIALGNLLLVARSSATVPALLLVGAALVVLIARRHIHLLKVPLLLPLALFLSSGWLSIGASYDPAASWSKFWLLVAGCALYLAIAVLETQWTRSVVVWGTLLFCAATALFFATQHDFAQDPAKLGIVTQIGLVLNRISPQFGFHVPHANLIAGILLLGLPFGIGATWEAIQKRTPGWAILYALISLWIALGLGMTTSRGAVFAFGIVIVVGVIIWLALRLARRAGLTSNVALAVVLNIALVSIILFFVIGGRAAPALINALLGSTSGVPRTEIFQQAFHLGQDASFSGIGLDTFGLNYASYQLLLDVLFLPHAHNLYLQVWIEQGIPGIVAFGWLILAYYAWVWRRKEGLGWLALASLASVTLMLLHGLVDVLFYFSRVLPVMFIPFGLTVSALNDSSVTQPQPVPRRIRLALGGAGILGLALIGLYVLSRRTELQAQWDANRGAVLQAQVELTQYHFPDHILSVVRNEIDESSVVQLFEQALSRDPNNRVANMRLGLIELDRADFAVAAKHLEAAYRADPSNRATVKALGYAYVWTGRLDEAVNVLRAIPEAPLELQAAAGRWTRKKQIQLAQNADLVLRRLKAGAQ